MELETLSGHAKGKGSNGWPARLSSQSLRRHKTRAIHFAYLEEAAGPSSVH